ncbi:MAG: proline--tRNA ligase [Myxococcota bacterium]|nr:proline--tRNA ligase [Myxococcota bacterium]
MRWSENFIPTLRDDPADAEAVSHKLLVRGGFIRQLMAGVYSVLPLGVRVVRKVANIAREEMDRVGAQEFLLPTVHPAELWKRSGRWESIGEEMFRLKDRRETDLALGMTHEEVFAHLAGELRSYKQLPQTWYQVQTKYRDEARPKSGLLRVREFTMKDSYSLDIDDTGLDVAFQRHFEAYRRIFRRCGFEAIAVEASSGMMGGSQSVEFMLQTNAGEDWIAVCASCGYAANLEKATSNLAKNDDEETGAEVEKFATPGVRTIQDLVEFAGGDAPADRQVKTLVFKADDQTLLVLLRGDHALAEQKLLDSVEAREIRPASEAETVAALGASPGSLGAVGAKGCIVVVDEALRGRRNMVTGANEDGFHLRGVDIERDIDARAWMDLREVESGEPCPMCDVPLAVQKSLEVGHIFKLGTRFSESLGSTVLDQNGEPRPIVMGSYGIGIERTMAAVVESSFDDSGIIWPVNVAPFEVVVTVLNPKEVKVSETAENIYESLQAAGIDVILDDRDERPGVKFKDAELVGIPFRLTVGPRGLEKGVVEFVRRRDGSSRDLPVERSAETVVEAVLEERF